MASQSFRSVQGAELNYCARRKMGELQRDKIDKLFDMFYCYTCLENKPLTEQSPDPRYCNGCCDFLLKEAKMLTGGKRPSWIPRVPVAPQNTPEPLYKRVEQARDCNKIGYRYSHRVGSKRGRKPIDIPMEFIAQITKEGITTCRGISKRLKDYGIECSFMTVARMIKSKG